MEVFVPKEPVSFPLKCFYKNWNKLFQAISCCRDGQICTLLLQVTFVLCTIVNLYLV